MASDPSGREDRAGGVYGAFGFRIHGPDLFVSGIVIAVCVVLYAQTFTFDEVPSSLAQNVQPATFPRLVLICVMLLALLLPCEFHQKLRRGIDLDAERREALPPITYATAAALVLFTLAMPALGVLPTLALVTLLMPLLWGERRWKVLIPYVLIFPIGVVYLFAEILEVTFPRGLTGGIFH